MEILTLLLFLQLKHWYADFKIQTYMQTVKKGVWLHPVGLSHSADHVWTTLVALVIFDLFILQLNFPLMVGLTLIEGVLHYIIDYVKVKYGCKDNTKPMFWSQFGLDQLAHQVTYLAMVYILLIA